jgi:hypothetical protein
MSTLQKLQHAVKHVRAAYIPKSKARRFLTGVNQLALREFTSLNAAGRAIGVSRSTGENRIRRTITDDKLADQLQQLLVTEMFQNRSGYLYCSMDHSQFGPFCIAVLAVSRRKGRAIPIWVQVNLSEAALIVPLLIALEQLFVELRRIAPKLKPVFSPATSCSNYSRRMECTSLPAQRVTSGSSYPGIRAGGRCRFKR